MNLERIESLGSNLIESIAQIKDLIDSTQIDKADSTEKSLIEDYLKVLQSFSSLMLFKHFQKD
jgi:hypothetical protein